MILGAGEIGGALARQLAAIDVVNRIVIVDDLANVAAGKALDVAQSAPVDGYHTVLAGTADVAAVVGAAVVLVADLAASPATEWKDEAGLALIKRIAGLNQRAPIICAGAAQASLVERGVNELGDLATAAVRLRARGAAIGNHRRRLARGRRRAFRHFAVGAREAAATDHRAVG